MKKHWLRYSLIAVVVVGVVLVFWRADQRLSLTGILDDARLTTDALPELLQRLREFHRVVTRDGEKLLEVWAKEASYYRDSKAVVIRGPRMDFYEGGKKAASISGNEGRVYLDGNDVTAVELEGNIRVAISRFILTAESVSYQRTEHLLLVPGPVAIRSADLRLKGGDLELDLAGRRLLFEDGVEARVFSNRRQWSHPPPEPSGPAATETVPYVAVDRAGSPKSAPAPPLVADDARESDEKPDVISSFADVMRKLEFSKLPEDLEFRSRRMMFDYNAGRLECSGDVMVVHSGVKLDTDQLFLGFLPGQPREVETATARGNVRVTRGDETASGKLAVYNSENATIVLSKNARLGSGKSSLSGEEVIVYLDEKKATIRRGDSPVKGLLHSDTLDELE
ncbi:MAG: LPS export ABC transporter periplasmic protein LptC [Candidatus Binatia bacterium]